MLQVLILGTAAGGGFPQWNCACENCRLSREGHLPARQQSSVAVSGDGQTWHIINVSPDISRQIERWIWPRLTPRPGVRLNPVGRVFLTNADLDHTLGLFHLRENNGVDVTAPSPVRASLENGLKVGAVLNSYGGINWRVPAERWQSVDDSGLEVRAMPLRSHPPRYDRVATGENHAVGLLFRDDATMVGIFPDVAEFSEAQRDVVAACDRLWFDGTFWSEDEMLPLSGRTASAMGHLPIGGDAGSLRILDPIGLDRVSYLHINNTNPVLRPDSAERAEVERRGARIAEDGQHFIF